MEYAEFYRALSLDGSERVTCGSPALQMDGSVPFTLAVLVRGNPVTEDASVIHQDDVLDLKLTAKGFSFWREGFGTFTTSGDASLFRQDEWNHLCVTYEPGTLRLFVNGSLNQVIRKTCQGEPSSNPIIIGEGIRGEIRQVCQFDRAFGSKEILELMLLDYQEIAATQYAPAVKFWCDFTVEDPTERVQNAAIDLQGSGKLGAFFPGAQLMGKAYLAIPNEPAMNPAGKHNDAYTVQAWINLKPFDKQDVYTIFANGDEMDEAGMSFFVARDGASWRLGAQRGDDPLMLSSGTVKPEVWTNVCLTYDGLQTQSLYLDGVLDSSMKPCMPISDVLPEPELRIGADLSHGDDNGRDCFAGSISRLDVWERALKPAEVANYASEEPLNNALGLLAAYDFGATDTNNAVSTNPLGLRNGVVIGETMHEPAKAPQLMMREATPEPLSPDELARCRADCLGNEESAPLRVSHLEKDGRVYFIGHYPDSSCTIAIADDTLELDDWTLWFIELILLVVGGVLALLAGIKLAGGRELPEFIVKNILPHWTIFQSLGEEISAMTILSILYGLHGDGLLIPLLKRAMFGLNWYRVSWSIIAAVTMAVSICAGLGLAYYIALLADLVVSLIALLRRMPSSRSLLSVSLTSVYFDHHADTSTTPLPDGEADGIAIVKNSTLKIEKPEWTSSRSEPCAYSIAAVSGKKITLKANFSCSDNRLKTLKIRVIDKSFPTLLGNSTELVVTFTYGKALDVILAFPAHKVADLGVGKYALELEWQCFYNNKWNKMVTTTTTMYSILEYPNEPWLCRNGHYPWVKVLDKATNWAQGAKTLHEAACAIEQKVNSSGLAYDVGGGGNTHYTSGRYFLLSDFLNVKSHVVNCLDCAAIVTTFANSLGCNLFVAFMYDLNNNRGFKYVPMKSIGLSAWDAGAFRYHAVAVRIKNAATENKNRAVYDACCTINGSANPASSTNRDPMLAGGINFSDYADGLPFPYQTLARASYREHFATNNTEGIGRCLYDWNTEMRFLPKP